MIKEIIFQDVSETHFAYPFDIVGFSFIDCYIVGKLEKQL